MAMVRQLTEGEIINGSAQEEESQSSEPVESSNSRPPSRSSSGSRRHTPVMPALQYTKDDLMKYSTTPLSKDWPSCLDPAYNNPTGKWDPERWFMNNRNDRLPCLDEPRPKRDRQEDSLVSHSKRKSSDPKERIKEEKDDIVLSPQRRSFGTGCHVIPQSSLARRPGSPTDGRDTDSFREPSRRIGSGRLMRDQRDWEQEYGYNNRGDRRDRFNQDDDKDMRRYSGGRYNRNDRRSNRNRIDEVEPEWFSGGPTSQSETIELVGFEDPHNDGEGRKAKKKRSKQNSRRSSLKSDEGEKTEPVSSDDKSSQKKAEPKSDDSKKVIAEVKETEEPQETKPANSFDLEELFKMDWIPGLLPNETPPETANKDMGCSRFSQWFRKDSPLHDIPGSGNNSRRSSLHEELVANVLNSIVEPQIMIPSPTPNTSHNFFAPISPALSQSSGYALPQTLPSSTSKDIMEMLQCANSSNEVNGRAPKESMRTVRELEADLKRIVLGGDSKKPSEEKSAFDKLLQHMSDSNNTQTSSLSMGPLDKSKALQEQDLLHDMLGGPRRSPMQQSFQMFEEKHPLFKVPSGMPSQFPQPNQNSQNDAFANLMHQKQHEQHMQQMQEHEQQMRMHQQRQQQMKQQQHMQNQLQQSQQQQQSQNAPMQTFTVDMLAKLLGPTTQAPVSPASPGFQNASAQSMNNPIQFQRQRELLSLLKQQPQQQYSVHTMNQPNLLQPMQQQQQQQRRCPSAKDIPIQQTLALPTLGISPRQSPLPAEALGSAIPNQGRIPSPLVFGQQPPALSHAPAPIHPAALAQAMNSVSPNTLQVQNPVVLQRVPSPQELAVHTQSILQNALIKRKLEEQKENFRKRQEAQRTSSPVPPNKNGMSTSPLKGLSPTIAFTPTSVMRKIQSEKTENKEMKTVQQQNGNIFFGTNDMRMPENSQNFQKMNSHAMSNAGIPAAIDANFSSANNIFTNSQNAAMLNQVPRAVHGQGMPQSRSLMGGMNSVGPPMQMQSQGQGRPIVKIGMGQSVNAGADLGRGMATSKATVTHNKQFLAGNNQVHGVHDVDPAYTWQSQVARQQGISAMPQQLQMAATYAALNRPPINPHNMMRPMGAPSQPPTSNFPMLRNAGQNPIRAQTGSMSQLNHLGQLAALQMQRGAIDSRQLQALAQSQRIHPNTLQHILMNSQNPVAAAQAQVGFPGNRDGKQHHLLPGQPSTNRQSPVNLTKWFGNDVLKQKMPEMPPNTQQKAVLVEELERQQQTVHN